MKKMIVMLLTLAMLVSLCACAGPAEPYAPKGDLPEEPEKTPEETQKESPEEAPAQTGNPAGGESKEEPREEENPGEVQEEPALTEEEQELELGGISDVTESWWYESCSSSGEYTDGVGNKMSYQYAVPAFNFDSSDAHEMNAEIEELCRPIIEEMEDSMKNGYSLMYLSITYEASVNGDIVSLLIMMETDYDYTGYYVFNLNVETGKRATGAEMAAMVGLGEDDFIQAAMKVTEEKFVEMYGVMKGDEYYEEQYAKTMSADVFSLSAPMYLNAEGQLCIIARIYSMAGAEYYDHILTVK